jgi:hypothetical protein
MADEFPVSPLPAETFAEVVLLVRRVRTFSQNLVDAANGQRITASEMAGFADKTQGTLDRMAELATVAGVAEEAKQQWRDDTVDVVRIFQRVTVALTEATTALNALAESPVDPASPSIANAIAKLEAVVASTKVG